MINKKAEAGIEMSLTELVTLILVVCAVLFIIFPIISIFFKLNYDSQKQSIFHFLNRFDNTIDSVVVKQKYFDNVKDGYYFLIDYNLDIADSQLFYENDKSRLCVIVGDKQFCKTVKNTQIYEKLFPVSAKDISDFKCNKNVIDDNTNSIKFCFLQIVRCDIAFGYDLKLFPIKTKNDYDGLNRRCSSTTP